MRTERTKKFLDQIEVALNIKNWKGGFKMNNIIETEKKKMFREFTGILKFGTEEEKAALIWEQMETLEKEAFAEALADYMIAEMCNCFDTHTDTRTKWKEMTNAVAKEVVLQATQMWL